MTRKIDKTTMSLVINGQKFKATGTAEQVSKALDAFMAQVLAPAKAAIQAAIKAAE